MLAALGDSLTNEELARDGREEAEAVVRAPVIEPAAATTLEEAPVTSAKENLAVLLSR